MTCELNVKRLPRQAEVWAMVFQGEETGPMWHGVRNGLEASDEYTSQCDAPEVRNQGQKDRQGQPHPQLF